MGVHVYNTAKTKHVLKLAETLNQRSSLQHFLSSPLIMSHPLVLLLII